MDPVAHSLVSGTRVRFRLGSSVCPEPRRLAGELTTRVELTGEVVLLSDYGDQENHFAVIKVEGVGSAVIVPVNEVSLVGGATRQEVDSHIHSA